MSKNNDDLKSFKEINTLLLNHVVHEMNLYRNRLFEPYGITGKQAAMLTFLLFNQDRNLTQRDFEREFSLRPSSINSILDYLEEGGYIKRNVSESDGRAKIITASEKGRRIFDVIVNCTHAHDDLFFQGFSEQEKAEFHLFLHRILDNIHNSQEGAICLKNC